MTKTNELLGFWTALPNDVLADPGLSSNAKVVYAGLLMHARPSRGRMKVWPGIPRLQGATGLREWTVKRAIEELVGRGLIVRKRRGSTSSMTEIVNPAAALSEHPCSDSQSTRAPERRCREEDSLMKAADAERTPRELQRIEDPMADEPPKKASVTRKRHYGDGQKIAQLYDQQWVTVGAPKRPSNHPEVLVHAGKAFEGLRHTQYVDLSIEEVMELGAERLKTCYKAPSWMILWGQTKLPAGAKLAEFLDGGWDRRGANDDGFGEARR
jgi:hypothetical protein